MSVRNYTQHDVLTVIELDDAIAIARDILSDFQYGYIYDDLQVEVASFMREKAFDAVSVPEEDDR